MLDGLYFSRMLFQKEGLSCWAIALLLSSISICEAAPPNVLIVLTDDQGWGDHSLNCEAYVFFFCKLHILPVT